MIFHDHVDILWIPSDVQWWKRRDIDESEESSDCCSCHHAGSFLLPLDYLSDQSRVRRINHVANHLTFLYDRTIRFIIDFSYDNKKTNKGSCQKNRDGKKNRLSKDTMKKIQNSIYQK